MALDGFLIAYGGALILPLAMIEGPIVTVVSGFLSARGYLDWYWAYCLVVAGDVIGDLIWYGVGRSSGTPLAGLGRRFGMERAFAPNLQRRLKENATKMLFIGKWTHSIGWVVLAGSGMLRVPLPRFMLANLIATLPKSAVLLGLGYFAGENYPLLERHFVLVTILLCLVGIAAVLLVLRRNGIILAGRSGG